MVRKYKRTYISPELDNIIELNRINLETKFKKLGINKRPSRLDSTKNIAYIFEKHNLIKKSKIKPIKKRKKLVGINIEF